MNNKSNYGITTIAAGLLLGTAVLAISSCARTMTGTASAPPPDVEVAVVEQKDIPVEREWIGTLDGLVNASVKAQVTGYVMSQNYKEGSFVHKGAAAV